VKSLERVLLEAEEDTGRKQDAVAKDARGVLTGEVERILAEAEDLHAQMANRRMAIHFLLRNASVTDDLHRRVNAFLGRPLDEANWHRHPEVLKWSEAHEALFSDANAALPR
jgi:hypothetical protein